MKLNAQHWMFSSCAVLDVFFLPVRFVRRFICKIFAKPSTLVRLNMSPFDASQNEARTKFCVWFPIKNFITARNVYKEKNPSRMPLLVGATRNNTDKWTNSLFLSLFFWNWLKEKRRKKVHSRNRYTFQKSERIKGNLADRNVHSV